MSITAPPFYRDEFGIGQARIARIMLNGAMEEMAAVHMPAFQRGYENDLVRASSRRRFADARAAANRALSVLRAMGEAQ